MPWRTMRLRDTEVIARVDASGTPIAVGGRVEIRYGARSAKAYQAGLSNLVVVEGAAIWPDDHCVAIREGDKPVASRAVAGRGAREVPVEAPAPDGAIVVYADGACSGNPGPAGLGMVLIDGADRLERSEFLGEGTNNVAELTAVLRALEAAPDDRRPLAIHTDSQYAIGVLTRGWKAKANKELVALIRERLAGRSRVRLHYVPGHSGVPLNERADELAREAVSSRRTTERRIAGRATKVGTVRED
jgi:ribonuclease HI